MAFLLVLFRAWRIFGAGFLRFFGTFLFSRGHRLVQSGVILGVMICQLPRVTVGPRNEKFSKIFVVVAAVIVGGFQ